MTVAIRVVGLAGVLALLTACGGAAQSASNAIEGAANSAGKGTDGYALGGTVAGLSGNGLILKMRDGSDLPIETNGTFTFPGSLASGTAYSISISQQPDVRRELCTVTNGAGIVGNNDVSSISVNCAIAAGFVYVIDNDNQIAAYGFTPGSGAPISAGSFPGPSSTGSIPLAQVVVA
ncbi:MAG: hypothetical protein WB646_13455, partial [Steroidobacteraceae bacterium]